MKQEILKGGTDTLTLGLYDHGVAVTPSSCTIRILEGDTVLESGTATSGVYTPTTIISDTYQDLVVEWTWAVAGGATQKKTELIDVVLFKLTSSISDQDLVREDASLGSNDWVWYGAVTGTNAGGFVDMSTIGRREDWKGAILTILSGTYDGNQYTITSFAPTTGTFLYTAANYPSVADTYRVNRSFQGEIDQAWADIYDKLVQACTKAGQDRPSLIMSPDRLRRPHLIKTLEKIYRGQSDDPNGIAWQKATYYHDEFEAVWQGLSLVFAAPNHDTPVIQRDGNVQWGFGR